MNHEMLWFLNIISEFIHKFIYSEVIRGIMHLFLVLTKKSAVGWIQPILEINNSHTLPFQKKSIHRALHLDLLDLLLKYRY